MQAATTVEPLFSLIVTTVGTVRLPELQRLVSSIAAQHLGPAVQVLLIYQSPDEQAPAVISTAFQQLENHCILRIPVSSLSAARNLGLKHATGRIIGFPDDDCWYPEGALSGIAQTFSDRGADAVCTHVMDPETGQTLGRRPVGEIHDVGYRRMFELPISVGLFVRRESVARVRATFDPSLGVGARWGAGEETDFVHTLLRSGCRCIYTGRHSVFHRVVSRQDPGEARKAYSYGAAFGVVVVRFLRAGTLGHIPFVLVALSRAVLAAAMYLLIGRVTAARLYANRLRGFCTGALEALAAR
jgi:glycosyltransferase involved in cell wall biosynthesis